MVHAGGYAQIGLLQTTPTTAASIACAHSNGHRGEYAGSINFCENGSCFDYEVS